MMRGRAGGRVPVTLKDVARDAQVSNTTASRVLTGTVSSVTISDATRQRVMEAASRLGYRPNLMARGLRTQRSGTIGVLVADITDPFSAALIPEVTTVFTSRGYQFLLSHAMIDSHADEALDRLLGSWVDGLLVVGDRVLGHDPEARILSHYHHVVGLARARENTMISSVNVDDTLGIRLGLEHLLALGHRQIGFIGNRLSWDMDQRLTVFLAEMAGRGLSVPSEAIALGPHSAAGGYAAATRLMAANVPITALLCAADLLALGAICALQETGWKVPESISVVGFDDIPLAAYTSPPLTTVRQPVSDLARTAATLLLDSIEGMQQSGELDQPNGSASEREPALPEVRKLLLPPALVVRRSTTTVPIREPQKNRWDV